MAYDFSRMTVLVVDDNRYMRTLVRDILSAFGVVRLFEAADGERAFDLACKEVPDVVITDWFMAPVDGLELTAKLRRDPASPNPYVPIVMVTGFSEKERVVEARDAGVTEFLAKPFTAKGILTRLGEVIERPRPFIRTTSYFGPDRRRKADAQYQGPERRVHEPQGLAKQNPGGKKA